MVAQCPKNPHANTAPLPSPWSPGTVLSLRATPPPWEWGGPQPVLVQARLEHPRLLGHGTMLWCIPRFGSRTNTLRSSVRCGSPYSCSPDLEKTLPREAMTTHLNCSDLISLPARCITQNLQEHRDPSGCAGQDTVSEESLQALRSAQPQPWSPCRSSKRAGSGAERTFFGYSGTPGAHKISMGIPPGQFQGIPLSRGILDQVFPSTSSLSSWSWSLGSQKTQGRYCCNPHSVTFSDSRQP